MSTNTPPVPDDDMRAHTTEPAEGDVAPPGNEGSDARQHSTDPAEGADVTED
ncbi:hypothetical protein [Cellulomonas sp. URHE0023]|uniref:hypothetical protein n=1 Tax=Cellulomonas sp. URHE0023 TaxID=1380354 RepID=UPI000AA0D1A9|nr:hypothetical protein [Cellulomonas sp. URHE0023]